MLLPGQTLGFFNAVPGDVKRCDMVAVACEKDAVAPLAAADVQEPYGPYRRHHLKDIETGFRRNGAPIVRVIPVLFFINRYFRTLYL